MMVPEFQSDRIIFFKYTYLPTVEVFKVFLTDTKRNKGLEHMIRT